MLHYFSTYRIGIVLGFLITGLCLWLQFSDAKAVRSVINRLNYLAYDSRLNATLPELSESQNPVVIIDIDEASLRAEGRWPWSRKKIGELVAAAKTQGVKTLGFDVSFAEAERNIATELINTLETEFPDKAAHSEFLRELAPRVDRDQQFAEQLREANVVLGVLFHADKLSSTGELSRPWMSLASPQKDQLLVPTMGGYNGNLPLLQQAARDGGFLNATPDEDGVIRRSPAVLRLDDNIYPSLPLAMAKLHNKALRFKVETALSNGLESVLGIWLNRYFIPTDRYGRVMVPYIGKRKSFPYISATKLLHAAPEELPQLKGAAAIVGTSALGLFDLRNTPMQPAFPGVEVQASVLQAMIEPQLFPREPEWGMAVSALLILVLGAALSLICPSLGPRGLFLLSLATILPLVAIDLWVWTAQKLTFTPIVPIANVILIIGANAIRGFFSESSLRQDIHNMFGQYVPAAHIDKMISDPDSASFAGESKDMSVLFCDIRNFTTISESLDATQLKGMLNDFFTPLTEIIFDSQGTIDKYIGDLVMAFWGAPINDPNHSQHAVEGALEMLAKVDQLRPIFVEQGLPEIHVGIGINSGKMNVGDMGSSFRRAYTVLGDAVNLGSRLEGLTKFYGVSLLIGEQTQKGLEGFLLRYIDRVMVKGKDKPVKIYQPICKMSDASQQQLQIAKLHEQAMQAYMQQRLDEADESFAKVLKLEPQCAQAKLFIERIGILKAQPPGQDWDGSYRHTEK